MRPLVDTLTKKPSNLGLYSHIGNDFATFFHFISTKGPLRHIKLKYNTKRGEVNTSPPFCAADINRHRNLMKAKPLFHTSHPLIGQLIAIYYNTEYKIHISD